MTKKYDLSAGAGLLQLKGSYKKSSYGRERVTYKNPKKYTYGAIREARAKDFLRDIGVAHRVYTRLESQDFSYKIRDKLKKSDETYHIWVTRKAGRDVAGDTDRSGRRRAYGRVGKINVYLLDTKRSVELSKLLHRRYYIGDDWAMVDVYDKLVSKFSSIKLGDRDAEKLELFDGYDINTERLPENMFLGGVFMYK